MGKDNAIIYDAVIVGGGAAGIASAIAASRKGLRVAILEKEERIGKKILATGNGKCNLAGSLPLDKQYNTPLTGQVFSRYGLNEILSFFKSLGLMVKEIEGRFYPYSEQSGSVLNALRFELDRLNVAVLCDAEVTGILKRGDIFAVTGKKEAMGKNILLTSGSRAGFGTESFSLYAPFGHKATLVYPSLVPLITDTEHIKGLKGVRIKAGVSLAEGGKILRKVTDEIIFKDNGLSGSAVFTLSVALARLKKPCDSEISIDFIPELSIEDLTREIAERKRAGFGISGIFHKEIVNNLEKRLPVGYSPKELAALIKDYRIKIKGLSSMSLAQVISGGLDNKDFDFDTMQSRLQKGLFAAGEVLDVDGECGGYNLMWAWASGLLAADGIEKNIKGDAR